MLRQHPSAICPLLRRPGGHYGLLHQQWRHLPSFGHLHTAGPVPLRPRFCTGWRRRQQSRSALWTAYGAPMDGRIIARCVDRWPAGVFGDWRAVLDRTPLFEAVESRSFEHPTGYRRTPSPICCLTASDVASLPPELRRAVAQEIDRLAATLPSEVVIQAVTHVELYRRRASPQTPSSSYEGNRAGPDSS